MILIANHRSQALALRHLAALRNRYPRADLIARRNAQGRYSNHGQVFVYEIQEEAPPEIEVVLHFESGDERNGKGSVVQFQTHIFAPGDAKDAEIVAAVRGRARGKAWPKGYREKTIVWGHPATEGVDRTDYIDTPHIPMLAVLSGATRARVVSRRSTVRKTRRTKSKRKAKK